MRNNVIGERVKEARILHSPQLTQEELATKLQLLGWNINRVGIAKIETGLRRVTDKEILLLVEALKVQITFLFGE